LAGFKDMDLSYFWAAIALAGLVLGLIGLFRRPAAPAIDLTPLFDRLQAIKVDVERLDRTMREDAERASDGLRKIGTELRAQGVEGETRQKESLNDFSRPIASDVREYAWAT